MTSLSRLDRIRLVSGDPDALARFYSGALGFARLPGDPELREDEAAVIALRLGAQRLDLVGYRSPGRPYPDEVPGWSPLFQHVAIVVSDMAMAHARLSAHPGWRPISTHGPERLPASSGGVTAFKFRDSEGHPLELLAFPPETMPPIWRGLPQDDLSLGYDHSAISIADTARSIAFYEGLGFAVSSRSLNQGPEQARLDGVPGATVEVTGLSLPGHPTPHVELLCYRGRFPRQVESAAEHDTAATVLVFSSERSIETSSVKTAGAQTMRDPDGHRIRVLYRHERSDAI